MSPLASARFGFAGGAGAADPEDVIWFAIAGGGGGGGAKIADSHHRAGGGGGAGGMHDSETYTSFHDGTTFGRVSFVLGTGYAVSIGGGGSGGSSASGGSGSDTFLIQKLQVQEK